MHALNVENQFGEFPMQNSKLFLYLRQYTVLRSLEIRMKNSGGKKNDQLFQKLFITFESIII